MLRLIDVLESKGIHLQRYKIHLATGEKYPPLDAFLEGEFKQWQEQQTRKNFECDHIVSLISLGGDMWLFAGVYEVYGVQEGTVSPYLYDTGLLPNQEDMVGRIVVEYLRPSRQSYIWGEKYGGELEITEIRRNPMTVAEFPGYNSVVISHRLLQLIVRRQEDSWRSALMSVKGIYLIADTDTGKLYVGSASGEEGIWQRWVSYAETGHGGNLELKRLLAERGQTHAEKFQYSILEIVVRYADPSFVDSREAHWKRALLSRDAGYNLN